MNALPRLRRLAAAVLAAACLGAGEPRDFSDLARPAIRSYAERDGLPHHTVQQIAFDARGRLWAATQGGPAVFDGRRWMPVDLPPEARSRFIRSLLEDAQGRFWFGTHEDGVWRLGRDGWTHLDTADGLPHLRVNHLLAVRDGAGRETIWAATAEGPAWWNGARWEPAAAGLAVRWTWRLVVTPDGRGGVRLWACTRGGLARWDGRGWVLQPEFKGLEVNDLLEVPGAPGPDRWVSCFGKGLAHWTAGRVEYPARAAHLPLDYPSCLALTRDPGGRPVLWAGTYNDGLACFRGGRWSLLTVDRGLRSQGVYALQADPRGRPALWIGMQGGGIASLSPGGWMSLQPRQSGFPSPDTLALAETPEAEGPRLWFGTPKGAVWFDGARWHLEDRRQGLPSAEIRCFALLDPAGRSRLVAGTAAGLAVHGPGGWRALRPAPPGELRTLLGARDGALWAATSTGLFRFKDGRWEGLPDGDGRPLDVLCLAETQDPDGAASLWAGTRGAGLLRWKGGRWTRTDPMPRYPKNWITSLLAGRDPAGRPRLWAGTRGQGLGLLDLADPGGRWQVFDARSPIPVPNTVIFSIAEDQAGRVYLGASGGIERLTFQPDGRTPSRVETFNSADGLLTNIVNPGACLVDHRGRIWFGLPEGPAFLDPAEAPSPGPLPSPILERFSVEGREADPSPDQRFPHGTEHLSFRFFTPVFFREEDLRFRTQLVGLEREPGPWTYENVRDFGGLGPGSYLLKVWARDHTGRVSAPMAFPFSIRPSPWLHPLAIALYVLAATLALVTLVRLRTRMLRRRNAWLQARVDEATDEIRRNQQSLQVLADHLYRLNEEKSLFMGMAAHDLRNPLQGIRLKAELLSLGGDPAARAAGRDICAAVDEGVRLLNRLLDLEAIETGRTGARRQPVPLGPVVARACALHQPRARAKRIELIPEQGEAAPQALGDPDTLAEVVDNLLTNAIKFSPHGRRVWVGSGTDDGSAVVWIRDEGPGFQPEDKARAFKRFAKLSARPTGGESSTGLGLAIVKRLVEDMGGRIELDSEPGHGATFRVFLPGA